MIECIFFHRIVRGQLVFCVLKAHLKIWNHLQMKKLLNFHFHFLIFFNIAMFQKVNQKSINTIDTWKTLNYFNFSNQSFTNDSFSHQRMNQWIQLLECMHFFHWIVRERFSLHFECSTQEIKYFEDVTNYERCIIEGYFFTLNCTWTTHPFKFQTSSYNIHIESFTNEMIEYGCMFDCIYFFIESFVKNSFFTV